MYGVEVSRSGSIQREIARNIERIESGKGEEQVCLAGHGEGGHSCICYRDSDHGGRHQCPCGAKW